MIFYKIDVIEALKQHGFNTNRIRKEKLISEGTLQALREGRGISFVSLDAICRACHVQPGDIIGFEDDSITEEE